MGMEYSLRRHFPSLFRMHSALYWILTILEGTATDYRWDRKLLASSLYCPYFSDSTYSKYFGQSQLFPYLASNSFLQNKTWNHSQALLDTEIEQRQWYISCTVTGCGLDDRGVGVWVPMGGKNFHFSMPSRPTLENSKPPIQWVPVASGGKAAGAWSWPFTSN
jgi:hypothetical protein